MALQLLIDFTKIRVSIHIHCDLKLFNSCPSFWQMDTEMSEITVPEIMLQMFPKESYTAGKFSFAIVFHYNLF